jgi:hypothetical protein
MVGEWWRFWKNLDRTDGGLIEVWSYNLHRGTKEIHEETKHDKSWSCQELKHVQSRKFREFTYNVTLRNVRATMYAVKNE